jgi:hypothetical protein
MIAYCDLCGEGGHRESDHKKKAKLDCLQASLDYGIMPYICRDNPDKSRHNTDRCKVLYRFIKKTFPEAINAFYKKGG